MSIGAILGLGENLPLCDFAWTVLTGKLLLRPSTKIEGIALLFVICELGQAAVQEKASMSGFLP